MSKKEHYCLKSMIIDLQAQLKRALFQQKLLSEKLERQRILFEKDAVSREEFDQVQTDYNLIEADISLFESKNR